jgi:glutamyl-tRNA reductase
MQLLCLGLSHRTAPVELRERFAVTEGELGKLAHGLAKAPGVREAVVISTCNRVELYLAAEDSAHSLSAVREFLATRAPATPLEHPAFFRHDSNATLRHLFRVVSGLDSMVLGETEILGQVKKAYAAAQAGGATSRYLNKLFQRAFNVAKEVRSKTNITRGSVSIGSVAVDLAEKIFDLSRCHVMILGAGETSELTAGALQARGVKAIFVANRSHDRAVTLAEKMGGRAIHFEDWPREFHDIDILIGSTAAPHYVVTAEQLEPVMRTRRDRPLFCIDLAVPRDIDPAVNDLKDVYLYDIDQLREVADGSMAARRQELAVCEAMIERHVTEFAAWLDADPQQAAAYATVVSGGTPEGAV